jgi:hypothetical protein
MVYLFIAAVILMIAAPIISVLPSKRDKARMAKRRMAMGKGISVEMTHIEDPDPDPQKYLSTTGKPLERKLAIAVYRLQRRNPANHERHSEGKWIALGYPLRKHTPISERWVWQDEVPGPTQAEITAFLTTNLNRLPADVVKVEEKGNFISVYWQEDGEAQEVIDFLERCAAIRPAEIDPEGKLLDPSGE